MRISKNWLKEYIEINKTSEELAQVLDSIGFEVEEVIEMGNIDEKVIVAQILKIEKHPNADKLQLATMTDGEGEMTVVCGAPNIKVGQKVPLAKLGAKLGDFEIKKASIRGVESEGMLCAEDELGLGNDHSGIIILSQVYELGKPYREYLQSDTIFEIDVTPNRGDGLSHIGIAREIAAALGLPNIKKEPISLPMINERSSENITVEVKDLSACPLYFARVIKSVKIGPSPKWLQERIVAAGMRPICNIVDVTNYIMLDLGQPLHAFDLQKVMKKNIIVRFANKGEQITLLDGTVKNLTPDVLVIADEKNPIAIAGIMGGRDSEVDEKTADIVLEAAVFDRKVIRKGKKSLNISTDASYRFERGVDPAIVEYAINKAAKMIAEISEGKVMSGIVKVQGLIPEREVKVEYDNIEKILGLKISHDEINKILKDLGFQIHNEVAKIPSWRHDINLWQDLVEEIGRIYGYDKVVDLPLPKVEKPKKSGYYKIQYIKDILANCGFTEVSNYSFLSEKDAQSSNLSAKDLLEIANPLQPENKFMRPVLSSGLLQNVAKNSIFDPVNIFEIGKVFTKDSESIALGVLACGKDCSKEIDKAKNILAKINLKADSKELDREILDKFKIRKGRAFYFEIILEDKLKKILNEEKLDLKSTSLQTKYRPVSKYPAVNRDLAFVINKDTNTEDIKSNILDLSEKIVLVELFDEYVSDKLGKDKKSIAYHIYMQDMDKTLVDIEADGIIKKVIAMVKNKFEGELRK